MKNALKTLLEKITPQQRKITYICLAVLLLVAKSFDLIDDETANTLLSDISFILGIGGFVFAGVNTKIPGPYDEQE